MIDSVLLRSMRLSLVLALFCVLWMTPNARAAEEQSGGVPAAVLLSVGFGEKFNDEKFINVSGLGVLGMVEFFNSDVWITGGLQTSLTFVGDLVDSDIVGTKVVEGNVAMTAFRDAPSEGWGLSPGIAMGLTIGAIPGLDIHLLGTVGASFAFLNRYQYQTEAGADMPELRVKIDEMDGQIGYTYGGLVAVAYTGSSPWLRGLTLGVEGAYHENTFNRWHLGLVIGFSF